MVQLLQKILMQSLITSTLQVSITMSDPSSSSLFTSGRSLGPFFFPPGSKEFDPQAREVVELLHVKALLEAVHKAVLRVQAESHGPQNLCVSLAQVVKGVHQLLQVRVGVDHVGCQDVVETVRGAREALFNIRTPDQLRHLQTDTIFSQSTTWWCIGLQCCLTSGRFQKLGA